MPPGAARLSPFLAAVIVGGVRLASLPRTPWQPEELGFLEAAKSFQPFLGHPQAPGYPVVVALTRVFVVFTGEAFAAMVSLSVVASVAGAVALQRLAARVLCSDAAGLAASLVFWLSPALLVYTPLPNGEATSAALATLALAVFASMTAPARGADPAAVHEPPLAGGPRLALPPGDSAPVLFGLFAAAAAGARPQLTLAVAVLVAVAIVARGQERGSLRAVLVLAITLVIGLVIMFVPLVEAVGLDRLDSWSAASMEATRLASAATRLGGRDLALRFVAHPWGGKLTSFPVLLLAAAGVVILLRRGGEGRDRLVISGLALFAAAHLGFCFLWGDRAGGVQPVIPAMIPVALFAVAPLARRPASAVAAATAFVTASLLSVWPLLQVRRAMPSAPALAADFAAAELPARAVVAYQPEMELWAARTGRETAPMRALRPLVFQPARPLYALVDGASSAPGARVFAWPASEPYGKLTTRFYRVTSVVPLPPQRRYFGVRGVHDLERTTDGEEWRWLEKSAELEIPSQRANAVAVALALPHDASMEAVSVRGSCGGDTATTRVARGARSVLIVPATPGCRLRLDSDRAGSARGDARELAVQLVGVELR